MSYGTGTEKYQMKLNDGRPYQSVFEGVIPNLERRHKETSNDLYAKNNERFFVFESVILAAASVWKPVVLAVKVAGLNIVEICELSIEEAVELFENFDLDERQKFIAHQDIKEISSRLSFMKI